VGHVRYANTLTSLSACEGVHQRDLCSAQEPAVPNHLRGVVSQFLELLGAPGAPQVPYLHHQLPSCCHLPAPPKPSSCPFVIRLWPKLTRYSTQLMLCNDSKADANCQKDTAWGIEQNSRTCLKLSASSQTGEVVCHWTLVCRPCSPSRARANG